MWWALIIINYFLWLPLLSSLYLNFWFPPILIRRLGGRWTWHFWEEQWGGAVSLKYKLPFYGWEYWSCFQEKAPESIWSHLPRQKERAMGKWVQRTVRSELWEQMSLWEEEKLMIFCRSSSFRGQMAWTTQESRTIVKSNLIITALDWVVSIKRDSNSMDHFCSYLPTLCGHLLMRGTEDSMTLLRRDCNSSLILYLINQWFFPSCGRGIHELILQMEWKLNIPSPAKIALHRGQSFFITSQLIHELPEVCQRGLPERSLGPVKNPSSRPPACTSRDLIFSWGTLRVWEIWGSPKSSIPY